MAANDYKVYQALLRGLPVDIHEGEPQVGYYWIRRKGERVPVSIFSDAAGVSKGVLFAWIGAFHGGTEVDPNTVWLEACKNPIPHHVWQTVYAGGNWPDEAPAGIGDNRGPVINDNDPVDLPTEVERAGDRANAVLKAGVKDKLSGDVAANLKDQLLELQKRVHGRMQTELEPYLDEENAIRQRWKPLVENLAISVANLRSAIAVYQDDAERKAQAAARAQIEAGASPDSVNAHAPRLGGANGRRTGIRRNKARAIIIDYDLVLNALKHTLTVREAVEKAAHASARAGVELPGMTIVRGKTTT